MRSLKSIYRELIRLTAICFGVLYLRRSSVESKHLPRSVSLCYIGFGHQSRLTSWCAHFSKSSQPHILLSGALLFIGHHGLLLEVNGILEALHGHYLILFQLYVLHYPLFGWCTGLWAYAQLKRALSMPCVYYIQHYVDVGKLKGAQIFEFTLFSQL